MTEPGRWSEHPSQSVTDTGSASGRDATPLDDELARARAELGAVSARLRTIEESTTWRATAGIRRIGESFPSIARTIRAARALLSPGPPGRSAELHPDDRPGAAGAAAADPPAQVSASDIALEPASEPVVSIIIPTYGQVAATLACLRSLARFPPSDPYEVIVVDDAYPDQAGIAPLEDVTGISLVRNPVNLGFLKTCNAAAGIARGEYLYLLNNDTELHAGAVDALVALLRSTPDVGMAGSKLLLADGRLQEAGAIVWRDASAWHVGRDGDPAGPAFEYLRESDYCSGASLLIRRSLWHDIGGFDEAFAPAYYEDVDLAFRVRERGLRVMYEPRSVLVHHEGVSHGRDPTSGAKASLPINQKTMRARWHERLDLHFPNGQHVLRARDRAWDRRIILVIDDHPPESGGATGRRGTLGIMESLRAAGWIVKFSPLDRRHEPRHAAHLERLGIEVVDHRSPGSLDRWMQENGAELDHVLVVGPDAAEASLSRVATRTDAVLSYHGLGLDLGGMSPDAAFGEGDALAGGATEMAVRERRIWRRFDLVIYPSEAEAAVARAIDPAATVYGIVPFRFDVSPAAGKPPESPSILFVGDFADAADADAARVLVEVIVPLVERALGPVAVTLAGPDPAAEVRGLASARVTVTGPVPDGERESLYRSHRVAGAPLRSGAGVKRNVVEALSRGLPLVTTSIGAQGVVGLRDAVVVEDEPQRIADGLVRLMTDDAAWIERSGLQTAFAERTFSPRRVQESVLGALLEAEQALPGRVLPWRRAGRSRERGAGG